LRAAAEDVRLAGLIGSGGIDHLFVKGATLAIRAYGQIGTKMSSDIDVLIAPAAFRRVGELLSAAGYALERPPGAASERRLLRYVAGAKETQWLTAARGTRVELHTQLTENRAKCC
jgi:hypothetical protein